MHRPCAGLPLQIAAIALAMAACSAAEVPSVPPTPSAVAVSAEATAAAGTAVPTSDPPPGPTAPAGALAWPSSFDVELAGTYWSDPPFRIPFSITVAEPGWYSGHLHADFLDLQRFDGITPQQFPNRMVGFADPDHVRGVDGDVVLAGLAPSAALDLLSGRSSLQTSNRAAQSLLGLDGARLDLHSATGSNPLFGGAEGNFGLGPELDVRLVLLPLHGRLLAVMVLAAPGDLDAAWEQALAILGTVELR